MGEVVKVMGKTKVLVKVGSEGKYISEIEKDIDVSKLVPNVRVALRSDSYALHRILPTKVDPLVSLMKVEKVRVGGGRCQRQSPRLRCGRPLTPARHHCTGP